jgi:hypothetical protein
MANKSKVNNGIINDYTIQPRNLTQYTAFRGVTDFSQIGQFNQFETGYSFLSVIKMPPFMDKLAEQSSDISALVQSFRHMLEYEFRGLSGLPDISGETFEITDGVNTQNIINKVTSDTSITVSSNYFEKSGSLITKFTELYLTGIKDRITQAKHYHGLIKNNLMNPGYENEVFTMMYYVTDNTMLRLEKAYLLCNCQLTKAETSIYDSTKGDISNKEMTIEWNCFPVWGYEVDKAASALLKNITGVEVSVKNRNATYTNKAENGKINNNDVAVLDSNDYLYGVMDNNSADKITDLVNVVK